VAVPIARTCPFSRMSKTAVNETHLFRAVIVKRRDKVYWAAKVSKAWGMYGDRVSGQGTRETGGVFENQGAILLIRESEAGVRMRVQN